MPPPFPPSPGAGDREESLATVGVVLASVAAVGAVGAAGLGVASMASSSASGWRSMFSAQSAPVGASAAQPLLQGATDLSQLTFKSIVGDRGRVATRVYERLG